jgi:sarcosine oxidase subunit alpha
MTTSLALLPSEGRYVNRDRTLTFTFQGQTIPALEGQTIGAALYAAGVRTFSRSFKYHRPRGLLCVSGDCPNCLMRVDGRPNVRTCVEPARQGQVVNGQNAWPGLDFDLLRTFDRLDYFLPAGFYYKRFHKPRWLWPVFEHAVRHIAGLGHIDVRERPTGDPEVEHLHTGVCVIGAGPAGLAAAAAAAAAGADVVLLEREREVGGHLLYSLGSTSEMDPQVRTLTGRRARVLCETTAFGLYEGNLVGAFQRDRLLKIRAGQVIVCTGDRQRPFLFANNDLPGIFLGRGVQRLARLHGVRAGQKAVVLTDNRDGYDLAYDLHRFGIEVVTVLNPNPEGDGVARPFQVWPGCIVLRARGRSRLRGVDMARINAAGQVEPGTERTLACDLLCVATMPVPANELLHQGGMRFTYEGGRWVPTRSVPGLWAAGSVLGTWGLGALVPEGERAGRLAAAALGHGSIPVNGEPLAAPSMPPSAFRLPHSDKKCFVCFCEDVTPKDIAQSIAEGFDHIETLKRYATVGMGPCQGKMCGQSATEVCALMTGRTITTVGTTTSRPPVVPVELAVLAAERRHHPIRRTPMHHWHQAHGARWTDAGQWKRPESYGDTVAEVRAVRNGVGLIDVSTLGKIDVIGPDAVTLLERIYVNGWADLAVGRTRYGVMCTEEGIVFDDGVVGRLGPEHFYLTATTGNAEAVFQWLELWRTTWRLNVTLLNLTSALAGANLAGPRSRDVLARLTTLDLSPAAFPYPALRQAEVAGVPCRLLRVGFVGELGYEIHCASAHGLYLWEALAAAGADQGLKPFGVEAQRILRLEKGHIIIGQDTDALANPFGAGFGKMIRFAKPQFHGRESLARFRDMGPRLKLIGFRIPDGTVRAGDNAWARGLEGCQVVERSRSVGRVTSARFSPTLGSYLGLAWVPENRNTDRLLIRSNGTDLVAQIVPTPFYDPDGARLKS